MLYFYSIYTPWVSIDQLVHMYLKGFGLTIIKVTGLYKLILVGRGFIMTVPYIYRFRLKTDYVVTFDQNFLENYQLYRFFTCILTIRLIEMNKMRYYKAIFHT